MFDTYKILYVPSGTQLSTTFAKSKHAEESIDRLVRTAGSLNIIIVKEEFEILTIPWGKFNTWKLDEYTSMYEELKLVLTIYGKG